MSDTLLVPYGERDDGVLVHASVADKATAYRCPIPECRALLVVRAGTERVRRHFAHRVSPLTHETLLHWTAKKLVAQVVNSWKDGCGERPKVERTCPGCSNVVRMELPDQVVRGVVEQELPNGLRPDVALIMPGNALPRLVEVFVTHEVDDFKTERLGGYKWIEVDAQAILDDPLVWKPRKDHLKPLACVVCEENRRRKAERAKQEAEERARIDAEEAAWRAEREAELDAEQRRARALGERHGVTWTAPYVARIRPCWKCRRQTVVFAWPTERRFDWARPPAPVPRSVRSVPLKRRKRRYWANPQGTLQIRPTRDSSKPANGDRPGLASVYLVACSAGKSPLSFVRQLFGPHLRTCA